MPRIRRDCTDKWARITGVHLHFLKPRKLVWWPDLGEFWHLKLLPCTGHHTSGPPATPSLWVWTTSWICVSYLHRGHANLLFGSNFSICAVTIVSMTVSFAGVSICQVGVWNASVSNVLSLAEQSAPAPWLKFRSTWKVYLWLETLLYKFQTCDSHCLLNCPLWCLWLSILMVNIEWQTILMANIDYLLDRI